MLTVGVCTGIGIATRKVWIEYRLDTQVDWLQLRRGSLVTGREEIG